MNDFYSNLIDKWQIKNSKILPQISIFNKVRDIPYGSTGEREPEEIVRNNLGSCSGKHILLSNLLRKLGMKTKIATCLHHFEKALPFNETYPKRLKDIINNYNVIDFHHFVRLYVDGSWVALDASWDAPLQYFGFPVNLNWDGRSDTIIAVKPIKFYDDTDDIIMFKQKLLGTLKPQESDVRSEFLKLLTDWLRSIR
jgi:hypothetical protein